MSRLARVLVTGGVLVVLSLGGTAHAQDAQPPSQPGGVTQPAPSPDPQPDNPGTPGTPGTPAAPATPVAPANPAPSADPGTTTTTTRPPAVGPIQVTVSPREGRPGTTVRIVIEPHGTCDPFWAFFQDRKGRALSGAAGTKPVSIVQYGDRRAIAQYTVSNSDAVGWGRFAASCDATTDTYRITWASFKVLPASAAAGNHYVSQKHDGKLQVPSRVDTGLGGTAGGARHGGLQPTWLLLPAGLLLITLAAALRLRQATSRRR
jgi:hypothetical protein